MAFPEGINQFSVGLFDQVGNAVAVSAGRITTDMGTLPVASTPADVVRTRLANSSTTDLAVDGSSSAKPFVFVADPAKDIAVCEIRIMIVNDDLKFEGSRFGSGKSLTNGLLMQITASGIVTEIANPRINEGLFELASPGGILLNNQGKKDILLVSMFRLGVLKAGTADNITITVRDDLTGRKFKHFTATAMGARL